jgi:hypothetical protein
VTCGYSGSETGGYINFVAYPGEEAIANGDHRTSGTVVMRGFDISSRSYIRIIGFEITHTTTAYSRGVVLAGTSHHIEILGNYLHHTYGEGGQMRWYNADVTNVIIRGNEFYMASCISEGVNCFGNGWALHIAGGGYALFEYNHAHRVGDFMEVYADHVIVRNNYLRDFVDSYWLTSGVHADVIQSCGAGSFPTLYNVYENNFAGDNGEDNSHWLQMRSTIGVGREYEILFRGNVGYNHGSYALQAGAVDYVRLYNNSYYRMITNHSSGIANFVFNAEGGDPSINNHHFNNVISDSCPTCGALIYPVGGSTVTASNNLCYNTPNHASCRSRSNPLFNDAGNEDFSLQSGSPARNLGKAITTVTGSSGSGRSFTVGDANFFCDGFGIAEGDRIIVGSNSPVRITSISGNTITVESGISWATGDNVVVAQMMDSASPDAGALPYRSGGYGITCELSINDAETVGLGNVTVTAAVNDSELVRFVEFWIDGVPVGLDYDSPYEYTWDTSREAVGSRHVLKVIARPLYASKTLAYEDRANVVIGSGVLPTGPRNLRFSR